LFVELPVHPDTAPYLVTSNKGMLWIDNSFSGSFVRSAVLRERWGDSVGHVTYEAIVRCIVQRGRELSWGNQFPATAVGLRGAREYLRSYDLVDCDLLTGKGVALGEGMGCLWVPEGCAVLVPRDRSYLGIVGTLGDGAHTVMVHNPSRGMAVLGAW
jgi:hypothetical protein